MNWAILMRRGVAAALMLWCTSGGADPLHDRLSAILKQQALDGIVWSTLTPAQGVGLGAAGLAEVAGARPMSAAHRVQVGSVAKTMLALGVLRLVTEGRLAL